MSYLFPFFNPLEWIKARRFHKRNSKYDKSTYDLELYLYSKILSNDMLHYGYFEDIHIQPETISIKQLEDAQMAYAQNIVEQVVDLNNPILDVGCGMGGLSDLLLKKNNHVEALTPNRNQIEYIKSKENGIISHHCKFEHFESERKFGTIINSESLQYISLEDGFNKIDKILLPGGRWIVVDYFRLNKAGANKSGHLLGDFKAKLDQFGWNIIQKQDITLNILPTLAYANMYVDRFLMPIKHFAFEKLRFKKARLYYLTRKIRNSIDNKIEKEKASIDLAQFIDEKKYMFFVLEKNKL